MQHDYFSIIIFKFLIYGVVVAVPVVVAKTPYRCKRTADRPIVYNLAGIKESIHCSKRVG